MWSCEISNSVCCDEIALAIFLRCLLDVCRVGGGMAMGFEVSERKRCWPLNKQDETRACFNIQWIFPTLVGADQAAEGKKKRIII